MACPDCQQSGKTKTIHFERGGRWETRIYCRHTYTKGRLKDHQIGHTLSRAAIEQRPPPRPRRFKRGPRIEWSEAMDTFILLHYPNNNKKRARRGGKEMTIVRDAFEKQFGLPLTKGQIIGRWHRIREAAAQLAKDVRQVPSLPVLKFMEGWQ